MTDLHETPAPAGAVTDPTEILECEQWLPQPVEKLFAFFCDPNNLEAITPAFLRFRVVRCSDEAIREGTIIDYRLRLHGIPMRWRSRIEEWVPNVRFVDRQLRGPYALWQHTHEFEPDRGGTVIRDRVRYRVPFGAVGKLVAGALVRRDIEAIFEHRRRRMCELFQQAPSRIANPS